jgi:hypothetical protein
MGFLLLFVLVFLSRLGIMRVSMRCDEHTGVWVTFFRILQCHLQ